MTPARRFWREVTVADGGIALDGRVLRTPARAALVLPTPALAEAVAEEWRGVGDAIDPRAMPLTGLANAAIDRIAPDPAGFAAGVAGYAESDLTCYRADAPAALVARQAAAWDPPLDWARARYDVAFVVTAGVVHVAQPAATLERLRGVVAAIDPFRLAGVQQVTVLSGSLVLALALVERAIDADAAFAAAELDQLWQAERWGEDSLATAAREDKRAAFAAAARFLALLG